MYSLLRNLLFCLPPEASHTLSLDAMSVSEKLKLIGLVSANISGLTHTKRVMGIDFPHEVGLAAGLDKNADHIDALAALGFSFLELGTLTPRPQPGNPKPRMFRLVHEQAIINRMGFNNKGIDYALERVRSSRFKGIIGINIGKNFDTPVESAVDDYLECYEKSYSVASYVAVNLSSPNTPGLRSLQFGDELKNLLHHLKEMQLKLQVQHGRYVPLAVKLAPDLSADEIPLVCQIIRDAEIDGVIATNTTLDRSHVQGSIHAQEAGGLSGAPLTQSSTRVLSQIKSALGDALPIIGVGGIMSGEDAVAKINAGASLVQLYSGFIYTGPKLISDSLRAIRDAQTNTLHH